MEGILIWKGGSLALYGRVYALAFLSMHDTSRHLSVLRRRNEEKAD